MREARRWVHGSGIVEGVDHGGPEGCVRIGGGCGRGGEGVVVQSSEGIGEFGEENSLDGAEVEGLADDQQVRGAEFGEDIGGRVRVAG